MNSTIPEFLFCKYAHSRYSKGCSVYLVTIEGLLYYGEVVIDCKDTRLFEALGKIALELQ